MPIKNRGSFITSSQVLDAGNYLASDGRLFFAKMQSDGKICVYRGSINAPQGVLWCTPEHQASSDLTNFRAQLHPDGQLCIHASHKADANRVEALWCNGHGMPEVPGVPRSPYFLVMQDDGNLCIYKGRGPNDRGPFWWNSGVIDPVKEAVEQTEIIYDIKHGKIMSQGTQELYAQRLENNTSKEQVISVEGSKGIDETTEWQNTLDVKTKGEVEGKVGIPLVAEGKITVSLEVDYGHVWTGSITRKSSWGWKVPVTVPAWTTTRCVIRIGTASLAVPYRMKGAFILRSGARVQGSIGGVYTGTSSQNMEVVMTEMSRVTNQIRSSVQAVKPA